MQILQHEIEGKLEKVAAEKGQHLTQHLEAYLPQPFSLAFHFTQVFNLFVYVFFLFNLLYIYPWN